MDGGCDGEMICACGTRSRDEDLLVATRSVFFEIAPIPVEERRRKNQRGRMGDEQIGIGVDVSSIELEIDGDGK
jgi:hypothetical protein